MASLPFCGEAVAYPIAAGNAAHHRAEDDGIKDVHARATAALFTSFDASDAEKEACASALKTEMCRTAFSACDVNANDAELEYCAHAHVPCTAGKQRCWLVRIGERLSITTSGSGLVGR